MGHWLGVGGFEILRCGFEVGGYRVGVGSVEFGPRLRGLSLGCGDIHFRGQG